MSFRQPCTIISQYSAESTTSAGAYMQQRALLHQRWGSQEELYRPLNNCGTQYTTALNSSDNLHSYPPDNHHSSDDVYRRGGDGGSDTAAQYAPPNVRITMTQELVIHVAVVTTHDARVAAMPHGPAAAHGALPSPNQGSVIAGQVIFNGSKPGLPGPANPPSPVSRRSLKSPTTQGDRDEQKKQRRRARMAKAPECRTRPAAQHKNGSNHCPR